jgi:hypothetical protein
MRGLRAPITTNTYKGASPPIYIYLLNTIGELRSPYIYLYTTEVECQGLDLSAPSMSALRSILVRRTSASPGRAAPGISTVHRIGESGDQPLFVVMDFSASNVGPLDPWRLTISSPSREAALGSRRTSRPFARPVIRLRRMPIGRHRETPPGRIILPDAWEGCPS